MKPGQRKETEFDRLTKDSRTQGHWVSRLVAFVIDVLIVNFIAFIIAAVLFLPVGLTGGPFFSLSPVTLLLPGFVALLYLAYFTLAETAYRKTPGKALLGLCVVTTDGTPLDVQKAFVRNLSKVYWLLLLDLAGFVTPLRAGQKYSDHLANTSVVSGGSGGAGGGGAGSAGTQV